MKPLAQTTYRRRDSHVRPHRGTGLPRTDYCFQADRLCDFGGDSHNLPRPSFRGISNDYFSHEAPGYFWSEATVFVLMAITAAVPVIQGARGAAHILRAFGIL